MVKQTKLEIRSAIKKRKPTYRRRQSNQFAKLAKINAWRRPKGMGNKSRRNRRGHIGMLQVGYGSPKEVKGTNRDGLFEVIVSNVQDLDKVESSTQIAILSRTLGTRKKLDVLKAAKKKSVAIGNVKDITVAIKEIESKFEEKKGSKKELKKASTKKVEPEEKNSTKDSNSNSKEGENKKESDKETDEKKSEEDSKKEKSTPKKNQSSKNSQTQKVSKKTTTTTTTTKKVSASSSSSKSEKKEVSKK